ncbi:hypothetical protein HNY73_005097 [Argiope bruennichi]|uniref:Uncharacterized protein n=1 Tax=Argiope bruennichi TaxID=94029 RepID=A0A8T0FKE0_ARGBR|nr:hypothetical protein HNY73_005097 [Argiope bruennichi]
MMENTVCLKSELDLFSNVPVQLAIDSSAFTEIQLVASLSDTSPIEFFISGNGDQYLDLAHTILHLQIKVVKKNGGNLATTDQVAPINYILNTLFSELSVFLNDRQVSNQVNFSYRAFLDALLFSSKSAQEAMLTSALFYKDTSGQFNTMGLNSTNLGFRERQKLAAESKALDLIGPLHMDIASQPRLLPNGVDVRIRLLKHKSEFALMSNSPDCKIVLQSASLFVRKVNVAPSIIIAQEKALEHGSMKLPIRRVDVRTFSLANGLQSITISNAFIGPLPYRIICGFVANDALNGNLAKNPFNFSHYSLSYLSISDGNKMYPAKPYNPDFASDSYARSYLSLFTNLNRYHNFQNININYIEYKNGYALHAIDLTPDFASNESHTSVNESGNISIDLKFKEALSETVSLVVYSEFRNTIEIDRSRSVFIDY